MENKLEKRNNDIKHVNELAEEILKSFIFILLEKVIDQESSIGKLDFSSIPPDILRQIKVVKQNIQDYEASSHADMDKWVLHKTILVLTRQVDYTIKVYHKVFYKLIAELNMSENFSFAYETFENVCNRMLLPEKSWYHIIALLCFAAELAVYVIKQGGPDVQSFLDKITQYVMNYIVKNNVAKWICTHGGWIKMIDYFNSSESPDRAAHILMIMTITEYTETEKWLHRIAETAVIAGIAFTVFKITSTYFWK